MDEREFVIPPFESLDPHIMQVFLDLDLDEISVLYYGRERPAYVHPVNDVFSYLLDMDTDEVVGLSLSQFLKRVIWEHPEMAEMIPLSTVLIGDFAGSFNRAMPQRGSLLDRARYAVGSARSAFQSQQKQESIRSVFDIITAYAKPV
jgi:hypothetical protein